MKSKLDYLVLMGYFFIIISACLLTYYFTVTEINSCTSDPFGYSIKFVKNNFEVKSVHGTITAYGLKGGSIVEYFGDNDTMILDDRNFTFYDLEV